MIEANLRYCPYHAERGIPERFSQYGLDSFFENPSSSMRRAMQFADRDICGARFLVLAGPSGCGKTTAAAALVNSGFACEGIRKITEDLEREYKVWDGAKSIRVKGVAYFAYVEKCTGQCQFVRKWKSEAGLLSKASLPIWFRGAVLGGIGEDLERLFVAARKQPVTVLDDVNGPPSEWMVRNLDEVVCAVYDRYDGLLIITTNLELADFKTAFGNRSTSRIQEEGFYFHASERSLRSKRKACSQNQVRSE